MVKKAVFSADLKPLSKLFGIPASKGEAEFVLFSCEAKESLGKRILWVDADVTLSDGSVRKIKGISLSILRKGIEYDIKKISSRSTRRPRKNDDGPRTINRVKITKIVIK